MSDISITWLRTEDLRAKAVSEVHIAPLGHIVTVKPPNRSDQQSAAFHALCSDLAKSSVQWDGERLSKTEWKRLLMSAFCVATRRDIKLRRGIEGELVALAASTTGLSVEAMSELIAYTEEFSARHGVTPSKAVQL